MKITNRQVKEFEGLPPSDEKRSVEGLVVWRVVDGKVAEAWAFPDTHSFMEQLGLTFPTIIWTIPKVLFRKLLPRTPVVTVQDVNTITSTPQIIYQER